VLAETEFFAEAPLELLAPIAAAGKVRELVRGDVLFEVGDEPDSIYVVLSGRIAIAIGNRPFDHRESVIALMDEGDLFGDMGMLDKSPRSAGARSLEASTVLEIPYSAVIEQLNKSSDLLWNVIRMLSRRLRAMDQALADSVFLDVTGRTAKRLLELSGGKDEFTLPVTQEELAGMVGASRERVNKAIASFIKLHWLEQSERTYHIIDRAKLEQRAI
ncbi:MAG: cyclic nucleotide-binding domain-containing protein, partial [Actinobacteria bacterium]|nr:cyclic nucleotide-binding domain-containing protein [Actinomycetota bacterium]